tara:strand:- start:103 stop:669 length:567 start_codon:yes stop_codon:yes gene_type:complete
MTNASTYQSIKIDGNTYPGADGSVRFVATTVPGAGNVSNQFFHISDSDVGGLGDTKHHLKVDGDIISDGTLTAVAKSFLIDHPTKEGMKLKHGSLEGPENGVYVRGHLVGTNGEIKLPDYWEGLVDKETITVNITPIGRHQKLYVKDIINNTVFIGNENLFNKQINCYYTIYGERKDIDKLVVEYDAK